MTNRIRVAAALWCAGVVIASPCPARPTYHTHAELSTAIDALASAHGRACTVESIGTSREGRAIWALRLARDGEVEPDARPAMLLAANIDGDHLIGSAVALAVVERLLGLAEAGDEAAVALLAGHTLYVVPRVNPDGAERFFDDVKLDFRRNVRPDDLDRDGANDEDPPNDLNGDGLITMMRVFDPDEADLMADPEEPRLNVSPQRDEGQRATFTLYVEGVDDDGDGEYNEDGLGGVDLNMNYMHGYREHTDGAGPYQVSEPEARALLDFVLAHQNIAVVLTYGRHDNLSKPPDGKGAYPSGAPKNIESEDVGLYKFISERFTELTELEKVPSDKSQGAFFDWAYAQFGVPSFATPLWTRPEPPKPEKPDAGDAAAAEAGSEAKEAAGDDEGLTPSGVGDISMETLDELRAAAEARGFEVTEEMMAQITPARVEQFAKGMGIKVRRVKGDAAAAGGAAKYKEDAVWLAYSDEQRDGAGFVGWQAFEHPQLGTVEIGGWVPYFKINPPPPALEAIAEKQTAFVVDLAGRFPKVSLSEPEITRLAGGLYEVQAAVVNDGYLPTGTAMAVKNRRARPYVVRLSLDNDLIVTGQRVNKIWSIPGAGGRKPLRWIIRAADGTELTITLYSEKFGELKRTVWLRESKAEAPPGGES